MRRTILQKILLLIFFFALIMTAGIIGLNATNLSCSHYIIAAGNQVEPDRLADHLYAIDHVLPENEKSITFTIKRNPQDGSSYSLLVDNLAFPYKIYVNGELVSQNTDQEATNYSNGYAYQLIDLKNPEDIGPEAKIQITGPGIAGTKLFLANNRVMKESTELRTIANAFMLFFLVLITVTSIIWYFKNRASHFFLVFALIGAVSIVKAIGTGELFPLAAALGFTAGNHGPLDTVLSDANLFLPVVVMIYLFGIPMNRTAKTAALCCCAALTIINMQIGNPSIFYLILTAVVYALAVALAIFGCVKEKAYCKIIFINNAVYASFVIYGFLVIGKILKSGALDFYIYPAYLGAVIYLFVFFAVFIQDIFRRLKELEEKKKEYERIALLRGISHDLKLPLSVIKMNNQMLEKYEMAENERKDCARMSTEATLELEKMTDNINSFLNLEAPLTIDHTAGITTNIQESFEKATRHYAALSKDCGYQFLASWQGEDAFLPIKPLQFERMLYNLLDNAFKYNKKDGKVILSCQVENKKAVITVEDHGTGMDKDQTGKIFTPFYRADDSRTKEGLGLGLCVVQGVVESLNGEINVESEKGAGTKITVILPLR